MTVVQVESSNRGVPVMGLLWRKAVARKCPVFRTVTAEVRWVALAPSWNARDRCEPAERLELATNRDERT